MRSLPQASAVGDPPCTTGTPCELKISSPVHTAMHATAHRLSPPGAAALARMAPLEQGATCRSSSTLTSPLSLYQRSSVPSGAAGHSAQSLARRKVQSVWMAIKCTIKGNGIVYRAAARSRRPAGADLAQAWVRVPLTTLSASQTHRPL